MKKNKKNKKPKEIFYLFSFQKNLNLILTIEVFFCPLKPLKPNKL